MKKLMLTLLLVLVTLVGTNASTFKSSILNRYATEYVSAPRDIVNPSLVVNSKTRFRIRKFDASKVSFHEMLFMAGNKTACLMNFYDSGAASRIAGPVSTYEFDKRVKRLEELRKQIESNR